MQQYMIGVWAGSGARRWNPQTVTLQAESSDAARRAVAEDLGLAPELWQGKNPPLVLIVTPQDPPTIPVAAPQSWSIPRRSGSPAFAIPSRSVAMAGSTSGPIG